MEKNEIIIRNKNGESNRSIAKALGISKDTVNKYVKEYKQIQDELLKVTDTAQIALIQEQMCSKPKRKKHIKKTNAFTDEVEKRFNEIIAIDKSREQVLGKNKQYLTAALIHKTLITEGYKLSESTIKDKYRKYKQKQKECFIKQQYDYGVRAEFDFHQVKAKIAGIVRIYHQATITLPRSNYRFGMLYENEKMENVIDSITQFIHELGGVPQEIVFDNMSNIVKRFICKGEKQLTDGIIKLSNYYGFKVVTTNPYSGNEKGNVENNGKFMRLNMFSLNYVFDNTSDLHLYYHTQLDKLNVPCLDEFEIEKSHLKHCLLPPYQISKFQTAKVNSYSLISIDGNFYSVPDKMVGKYVNCNVFVNHLVIYDEQNNILCKHNKIEGNEKYSIDIHHYINTFLKKPGALKNSLALKQAPAILQTFYHKYFTTDPKLFLYLLTETNQFNADDSLLTMGLDTKILKEKYPSKLSWFKRQPVIEEASINQINEITKMFKELYQ